MCGLIYKVPFFCFNFFFLFYFYLLDNWWEKEKWRRVPVAAGIIIICEVMCAVLHTPSCVEKEKQKPVARQVSWPHWQFAPRSMYRIRWANNRVGNHLFIFNNNVSRNKKFSKQQQQQENMTTTNVYDHEIVFVFRLVKSPLYQYNIIIIDL